MVTESPGRTPSPSVHARVGAHLAAVHDRCISGTQHGPLPCRGCAPLSQLDPTQPGRPATGRAEPLPERPRRDHRQQRARPTACHQQRKTATGDGGQLVRRQTNEPSHGRRSGRTGCAAFSHQSARPARGSSRMVITSRASASPSLLRHGRGELLQRDSSAVSRCKLRRVRVGVLGGVVDAPAPHTAALSALLMPCRYAECARAERLLQRSLTFCAARSAPCREHRRWVAQLPADCGDAMPLSDADAGGEE